MNSYLLYTRDGQAYIVKANFSHVAMRICNEKTGKVVSCWFMGESDKNAIALN